MLGARRYCCATAGLLAQLAFGALARAGDSPSTVIVSSNTSDARLTRALVLIRGELSALGLDVQVRAVEAAEGPPSTPEVTSERLSLDVKEGVIVVRVFAAGAQAPLVESVDLDGPDVTAEVIAVRAVEALRAARLLPSRKERGSPTAPRAQTPTATHPPVEQRPTEHPAAPAIALPVPTLQLSLGSTFVANAQGLPQPSAHAAIRVGPHWGFVALGVEGSLADLSLSRSVGSAQVSRRTLFLELGARVRVHRAWELNARGGVSYLHYSAKGVAEPGYLARSLEHGSGALALSIGGAHCFSSAFAVYLDVGGLVAFDAARIRLGNEEVVTLDHPSLSFGAGVLLGVF